MQLLSKNKNIPKFVQISPKQSTITIVLPEIDNDFGIYVKANTIDLYNDKIVFDCIRRSRAEETIQIEFKVILKTFLRLNNSERVGQKSVIR